MNAIEMRQKRANLWEQAKELNERAKAENRDLSAEEKEQWNRLIAEMDALKERIDREERLERIGTEFNQRIPSETVPAGVSANTDKHSAAEPTEYRKAFWDWVRYGNEGLEPERRTVLRNGFTPLGAETRALGVSVPTAGGYTVADEDMQALVDAMKAFGGMREVSNVFTTATGADLPIPTSDDTSNKGVRVAENVQIGEQDVTVGQKILKAYTYTSKIVRVSLQLLQDASFPIESWLTRKLAERIARITNEEFTTGSGTAMPEGVLTGATLGASTASSSAITYAELLELLHSVDPAYRRGARWMMADSTLKYLKGLVDGDNRPLWLPGLAVREPDTLLGYPYTVNQDIPAIAGSAKVVLFGDFANYYIRDVAGIQLIRLTERYADYLQVGFLAFSRHDGALVDAGQHPIKYLQMHA